MRVLVIGTLEVPLLNLCFFQTLYKSLGAMKKDNYFIRLSLNLYGPEFGQGKWMRTFEKDRYICTDGTSDKGIQVAGKSI